MPPSPPGQRPPDTDTHADTLRVLFERSVDPIFLFNPALGTFEDANPAAVRLLRCASKEQVLANRPAQWAPPFQPDGRRSDEAAAAFISETVRAGAHRFEWLARGADGVDLPVEIVATAITSGDRPLHVVVARDITERRAAEAALRESREILASVADNISEGIYRSDREHRLIFVNRAYLRMFGYASLDELQGIQRETLYANPDLRPRLLERLARDGGFDQEEVEYVRPDGSRFWGLTSSHAIRDPRTGAVAYHVGAIADITERRAAADQVRTLNATLEERIAARTAALSESEASLRTLIEHAPEAIVVYDADTGLFLSGNGNALRLFGVAQERLRQLTPLDVSPPVQADGQASAEAARALIEGALAGAAPMFEWIHLHASGSPIPCEIRLVRLPSEGRRLLRASITDNTERQRRQRTQQATYLISEAVHGADDLAALYARIHGIIQDLMPARNFYIALYSAESGLITFPYFRDEFGDDPPEPRPIDTGLTGAVLQSGQPLLVDGVTTALRRDSSGTVTLQGFVNVRYIESGRAAAIWLGVPLKAHGRTVGAMAVQDYQNPQAYGETEKQILAFVGTQTALAIERKRVAADLRRALDREKELGVLKSNFVSMVSHEFRTPLGIIMSSAGILEKYHDRLPPEERRDQLASIQRSTRRMGELMEEVLLLARLDAGRIGFEPKPFDLRGLCRTVAEEVASVTIQHCPILVRVEANVTDPGPARGDERLLRNILTNLLTNAAKYSDAGSPVELSVTREFPDAVIVIRDRGIGIPEADREWLFHAFHRGRNVGSRAGTGLGLVIVQRCLELHDGRIEVESTVGLGTTFTVRIPLFAPSAQ
ncbi:MAG: PAS domain S-box protein [Limisphaerales bacterium]